MTLPKDIRSLINEFVPLTKEEIRTVAECTENYLQFLGGVMSETYEDDFKNVANDIGYDTSHHPQYWCGYGPTWYDVFFSDICISNEYYTVWQTAGDLREILKE